MARRLDVLLENSLLTRLSPEPRAEEGSESTGGVKERFIPALWIEVADVAGEPIEPMWGPGPYLEVALGGILVVVSFPVPTDIDRAEASIAT